MKIKMYLNLKKAKVQILEQLPNMINLEKIN